MAELGNTYILKTVDLKNDAKFSNEDDLIDKDIDHLKKEDDLHNEDDTKEKLQHPGCHIRATLPPNFIFKPYIN